MHDYDDPPDDGTIDLRLVRDPNRWRDFVRQHEPEFRAMANDTADADLLIERLLGWPPEGGE
jgi:hypothetical protein